MASPFFSVSAEAYDRLMGRFLPSLAPAFADAAEVSRGQRLIDVGCGPGGLTTELARRVGAARVAAVDPSPQFVEACRARIPGVDARVGVAEDLPFATASFDLALSSLVVAFMDDAPRGVGEMVRVTRPGGRVALCFWDVTRHEALETFWRAATSVIPSSPGERKRVGSAEGDLGRLLANAGCEDILETAVTASAEYTDFEDYWSGCCSGVGPIGGFTAARDASTLARIRDAAREMLGSPTGPFTLTGVAWVARGDVPDA